MQPLLIRKCVLSFARITSVCVVLVLAVTVHAQEPVRTVVQAGMKGPVAGLMAFDASGRYLAVVDHLQVEHQVVVWHLPTRTVFRKLTVPSTNSSGMIDPADQRRVCRSTAASSIDVRPHGANVECGDGLLQRRQFERFRQQRSNL